MRVGSRLEDLGEDGSIILKLVLKSCMGVWTGFIWLRIGTHGDELLVSIKCSF